MNFFEMGKMSTLLISQLLCYILAENDLSTLGMSGLTPLQLEILHKVQISGFCKDEFIALDGKRLRRLKTRYVEEVWKESLRMRPKWKFFKVS